MRRRGDADVIDTNILVSFAIRPSPDFERIFDIIAVDGISLISEDTVSELLQVLRRDRFRRYVSLASAMDYVDWYIGISEMIVLGERLKACRDPRDDKFLEVAMSGHADFIVSGDTDLLLLDPFRGISIVRPPVFLNLAGERAG